MCATPLINNISTIQQIVEVTNNNKFLIDLINDCEYCFDELFRGIKSFCRPSCWKKVENEFNMVLNKEYYHVHIYRIDIKGIINFI